MTEKYCLKWNDFQTYVSKSFGLLRNEEYLYDVTLVCDDNSQVSAHKLVLSACSEYFKAIFKNNNHPSPLICLDRISTTELRNILDYVYNGEAKILHENLENFLTQAKRLKLLGLDSSKEFDVEPDHGEIDHVSRQEKGRKVNKYKEIEENYDFDQEESFQDDSYDTNKDLRNKGKAPKLEPDSSNYNHINHGDIDQTVFHANGSQQEINRKVDEYIETFSDGNLKCLFCGKLVEESSNNNKGSRQQSMRNHVETHLEGISYQCKFCEKVFRFRNSLAVH